MQRNHDNKINNLEFRMLNSNNSFNEKLNEMEARFNNALVDVANKLNKNNNATNDLKTNEFKTQYEELKVEFNNQKKVIETLKNQQTQRDVLIESLRNDSKYYKQTISELLNSVKGLLSNNSNTNTYSKNSSSSNNTTSNSNDSNNTNRFSANHPHHNKTSSLNNIDDPNSIIHGFESINFKQSTSLEQNSNIKHYSGSSSNIKSNNDVITKKIDPSLKNKIYESLQTISSDSKNDINQHKIYSLTIADFSIWDNNENDFKIKKFVLLGKEKTVTGIDIANKIEIWNNFPKIENSYGIHYLAFCNQKNENHIFAIINKFIYHWSCRASEIKNESKYPISFEFATYKPFNNFESIYCFSLFCPDDKNCILLSGIKDKEDNNYIQFWNVTENSSKNYFKWESQCNKIKIFKRDTVSYIACASNKGKLATWKILGKTTQIPLNFDNNSYINCFEEITLNKVFYLLGGCEDKFIKQWDTNNGNLINTIICHMPIKTFQILPINDFYFLVCGHSDGKIKIWDYEMNFTIYTFDTNVEKSQKYERLDFMLTTNNKFLVTINGNGMSDDSKIKKWTWGL